MTRRRLQWLLAILLLAAQGAALAHQLGHAIASDAQDCVICPVTTQPAALPGDTADIAPNADSTTTIPLYASPLLSPPPFATASARAPPLPPIR